MRGKLCKGLGQGEVMVGGVKTSRWSAGGEDELCGELAMEFIRSVDTLSNGRHLSLCWGTGGHIVSVWLRCSVCEHMCLNDSDSLKRQQVLSHLRPNPAECVHKYLNVLCYPTLRIQPLRFADLQ